MAGVSRVGVATRYSDLVILDDVAYFSGYVPETSVGQPVAEQTRDILEQIAQSLAEIGSDKTKVLHATIWLADMGNYDAMNEVWDSWVPAGHAPARVCVENKLADPSYAIEIQVTAAL
ncbi:RidA family protein [Microvirga rosea]|uniref:RidA family protein n=1 Tax=Microvirga rosea TaxID=2715425 RepID=UPI001D0ACE14|nr:RidA family protein [Microvirga rosea]MCB8821394.1 RidA family protein [Microvirga rosea]